MTPGPGCDRLAVAADAIQRHISPIGSSMKHFTLLSNLNALVPGRVKEAYSQVTGRLLSQPPVNQLSYLLLHLLFSKKMKKVKFSGSLYCISSVYLMIITLATLTA